jgi:hypothetical protein
VGESRPCAAHLFGDREPAGLGLIGMVEYKWKLQTVGPFASARRRFNGHAHAHQSGVEAAAGVRAVPNRRSADIRRG